MKKMLNNLPFQSRFNYPIDTILGVSGYFSMFSKIWL